MNCIPLCSIVISLNVLSVYVLNENKSETSKYNYTYIQKHIFPIQSYLKLIIKTTCYKTSSLR